MARGVFAECPQCGKMAFSKEDIDNEFGYRYGGTKPQSWCKECRANRGKSGLSREDAALNWLSSGKDEDYTFGYNESELEDEL